MQENFQAVYFLYKSVSMMKFQRQNPYNKFLPYAADLEEDAEKYFKEIKGNLQRNLRPKLDLVDLDKWLTNLQKYIALYGLR